MKSWEKILWGKKWRCWSLFCKLIRGNFHLSQQLQVSTFLLISSAIPSHFPLIMSFAFFTVCIYFNNISNPNSPLSMNSLHISTKSLRADRFLCLSQVRELHLIKIGSPDILYSLVINVGNSFQLFFFQILFSLFVYKIITILRVCVSVLHPGFIYPGFVHTHGSTTCNSVSIFVQPSQLGQLLVNLVNFFAHTHSSTRNLSVHAIFQFTQSFSSVRTSEVSTSGGCSRS